MKAIYDTEGMVRLKIRPNESGNLRALLICVLVLILVIAAIGIMLALQGAWLVLPFAGLEILILATGAICVGLRAKNYESVIISRNFVHITKFKRPRFTVKSFAKHWICVQLCSGRTRHEPSRLVIGLSGQLEEVGSCLTEYSRKRLYRQLKDWLKN